MTIIIASMSKNEAKKKSDCSQFSQSDKSQINSWSTEESDIEGMDDETTDEHLE